MREVLVLKLFDEDGNEIIYDKTFIEHDGEMFQELPLHLLKNTTNYLDWVWENRE